MSEFGFALRQALKQEVDELTYQRGLEYYREGRVGFWAVRDVSPQVLRISGTVNGSETYDSSLTYNTEEQAFTALDCSCPMGTACKHIVALGLTYAHATKANAEMEIPTQTTTDAEAIKEKLKLVGLSAEQIPDKLLKSLMSSQSKPGSHEPTLPPSDRSLPRAEEFDPNRYFILLSSYQGFAPSVHELAHPNINANVTNLLARKDLTQAQRELLTFVKDARSQRTTKTNAYDFFRLLTEAGFPVYKDYYVPRSPHYTININPKPLSASLTYEPEKNEEDPLKVRHTFFFRMPKEYWEFHDNWNNRPFFHTGSCILHEDGNNVLNVYQLTPELAEIVARVDARYDYSNTRNTRRRDIEVCETRLSEEETIHLDTISRDAQRLLHLSSTPLPSRTSVTSTTCQPSIVVEYDATAQTLRVKAAIDYGFYWQDVSETVHLKRLARNPKLVRTPPFEQPGSHIIIVTEDEIQSAPVDEESEIELYREVSSYAEEFGFTKTLKCTRKGAKQIAEYLAAQWPQVLDFAEFKEYPVIFAHDQLPRERVAIRTEFNVDLQEANDWLSFDVACYCGDEKITLEKILTFVERGDTTFRRKDGSLVTIDNLKELQRLAEMLKNFHEREGSYEGKLYNAPEIGYIMTSSPHYSGEQSKSFQQFMKDAQSGKPVKKVTIPARIATILRPYQKQGIDWLYFLRSHRFGGILADDMGLGKTLQALTLLAMEKVEGKPSLIICPKTLLYNWKAEAEKFTPDMSVLVYDGTPAERKRLAKKIASSDLVVVSYSTIKQDEEVFVDKKSHFNYVVLDEAQFIKNHVTKTAQFVKRLNADYRLALTGTPLENSVSEIWSAFDFLMPGFLGNNEQFKREFQRPIMEHGDNEALEHLKRKIACFMLRRTKTNVLKELPPKIEQTSLCHLGDAQNVLYQQVLAKVKGEVFATVEEKGFKSSQIHILAGLTKLRQACNHPSLLLADTDWQKYESTKLDACLELVNEIVSAKRKVLIFSQFTKMLDIVAEALAEKEIPHLYLSGKTQNRQTLVNTFNTDPTIPVFLISLKAGGTGLNLTSADTVIIFDPWWNPSVENQAADRTHRIGQTKTVNVYRLITTGTIEEKIQALKEKKRNLFDALVGESGNLFKKLTWEDVRELFQS